MTVFTNGACRIYTPTSGRPLSPKFGQGGGKGGRRPLSQSLDVSLHSCLIPCINVQVQCKKILKNICIVTKKRCSKYHSFYKVNMVKKI